MKTTRRLFAGRSAAAGFFIAAGKVYGQSVKRDEQRLRVFKVGTGGMGGCDIRQLLNTGDVVITGLCDVAPDSMPRKMEGKTVSASFENVPRFTDYREMMDRISDQCDAVCISTPDHTHACIALRAMAMGKHVYVQKPCCHTFEEGQKLIASAEKHPDLATQMGNQHHSGPQLKELQRECIAGQKDAPNPYEGTKDGWYGLRHYSQWTRACIEGRPESCTSRFAYSVRLSQLCVLGNIAQILSGTELAFDPKTVRFDNDKANAMLAPPERKGFECIV